MQIAHTTPAGAVIDVPLAPRPFFDAVAIGVDPTFGMLRHTTPAGATDRFMALVDRDRNGVIAPEEARRVDVRDQYTTFHKHNPNDFFEQIYVDATVTYDGASTLLAADSGRDGLVSRAELEGYLLVRAGLANASDEFFAGSVPHQRLLDAFAGASVAGSTIHGEQEYRMPW